MRVRTPRTHSKSKQKPTPKSTKKYIDFLTKNGMKTAPKMDPNRKGKSEPGQSRIRYTAVDTLCNKMETHSNFKPWSSNNWLRRIRTYALCHIRHWLIYRQACEDCYSLQPPSATEQLYTFRRRPTNHTRQWPPGKPACR